MTLDGLPDLPIQSINSIIKKIDIFMSPKCQTISNPLFDDIKKKFKILNNQLKYIYDLEHNPLMPNRDEFLDLLPKRNDNLNFGLIYERDFCFENALTNVKNNHCFSNFHIFDGMKAIWGIFSDSQQKQFLSGFIYSRSI